MATVEVNCKQRDVMQVQDIFCIFEALVTFYDAALHMRLPLARKGFFDFKLTVWDDTARANDL